MNKITFAALTLIVSTSALATPENLVRNGSFEDLTGITMNPTWAQSSALTGWSSTNDAKFEIQLAGTPSFATAYDGAHYLELNSNKLGGITQTLSTIAGQSYALAFGYANRQGAGAASSFEVYWGDTLIASLNTASTTWTSYSGGTPLLATSDATTLAFVSTGPSSNPSYGSYLDGVSVTTVSAVPEPETYAMLLTGLGLMATIGRRRGGKAKR